MPYNDRLYQLLNDLDDSELEDLWVHGLQCKPDDAEFRALSHELKVDRISTEWRAVHGHLPRQLRWGTQSLSWKRMLIDVADKLNPVGAGRPTGRTTRRPSLPSAQDPRTAGGTLPRRGGRASQEAGRDGSEGSGQKKPGPAPQSVPEEEADPLGNAAGAMPILLTYRKTVNTTLMLLGAHELRRQLAELG
jgi:hypothetical protein